MEEFKNSFEEKENEISKIHEEGLEELKNALKGYEMSKTNLEKSIRLTLFIMKAHEIDKKLMKAYGYEEKEGETK